MTYKDAGPEDRLEIRVSHRPVKVLLTVALLATGSAVFPMGTDVPSLLSYADFEALYQPFVRPTEVERGINTLSEEHLAVAASVPLIKMPTRTPSSAHPAGRADAGEVVIPHSEAIETQTEPRDPFAGHPLAGLFRKLLDVEHGNGEPIHIVHLGDSEIASDAVTMTTRRLAADRFGDGGPGFVLAMKPWPSYSRSGVLHEKPEQFEVVSFPRAQADDGRYGPGGVGFDGSEAGGTSLFLRSELRGKPCEVGFIYLQQIGGGHFRLSADGKTYARPSSHGAKGTAKHTHRFDACPKRLKFHWSGRGQFRAFGWQFTVNRRSELDFTRCEWGPDDCSSELSRHRPS